MFKRITIELTGPICSCEEQQISWCPVEIRNKDGIVEHELHLSCKECKTKLLIPNGKFKAIFVLEKPYPGKKETKKPEEVKEPSEEEKKLAVMKQEEVKKSIAAQAVEEEKKKFN